MFCPEVIVLLRTIAPGYTDNAWRHVPAAGETEKVEEFTLKLELVSEA